MKTIDVKIFAFHGYGCCGGSYSSEETVKIEVSDEAGATIKAMLSEYDEVDQTVFKQAIEDGHEELQDVYDAIDDKHSDMVARYWLFDADNPDIDEVLQPYFWKDIENKLYIPEKTLEECIEDLRNDDEYSGWNLDDEEDQHYCYYQASRQHYLDWVNSHEDDYWFIADRTGLSLDLVYDDKLELELVVTSVE